MTKKILVLPGDGIGREVCDAAIPVFDQLGLPLTLEFGEIGWECWRRGGDPVPEATWRQIRASDAVLLGAITSKGKTQAEAELAPELQGQGLAYVSPVIQLRKQLDAYVNVRPAERTVGGGRPFRLCVLRENTEGLYVGLDRRGVPAELRAMLNNPNLEKSGPDQATFSVRLQTRFGLTRLFDYAFAYARANGHDRVTLADKANVLRESGQFAADLFHAAAAGYPEIAADIQNVDAVALRMVTRPETYGVIVAENMFGDILSDLAGGVMGGLGVAPSANVGGSIPYYEPVHGSAPALAGKGVANPSAMFLTIALMLEDLGFAAAARSIRTAVRATIARGRIVTYDLGGDASTGAMADAILAELKSPEPLRRAAVLSVGDSLLDGRSANAVAPAVSRVLAGKGDLVSLHLTCGAHKSAISNALVACLGQSDVIAITGDPGLLRGAVASALGLPADFPGARLNWRGKTLYLLPEAADAAVAVLEDAR
jgi:isocitrate/isopropylmalate dehydrogenase